MSEILEALILGIVQGLTEFLPVSSSGHLEIVKFLFGNNALAEQSLLTSVFLHFATALATILVFRKEVRQILRNLFVKGWNNEKQFSVYIVISMIPASLVGFFMEDFVAQFFNNQITFVAYMLIITGFILLISERIHNTTKPLNSRSAFVIGISQAIAVLPGISRSGTTIGTALLLGIEKSKAARFSFLMVVPLIFGKMAKDLLSGEFMNNAP
ncbi:MAG: undecaprenyl-diphosphate phosphatase, partial [Saprospiraceae bacterium]|nr:undecaprenyl-diphosphate phosphatase [Saprospiraceae bacterium]